MKKFLLTILLLIVILIGCFMIDMWRFAEGVRNDSLKHGQGLESDTVFYIEEISDNIDSTMIKPN